MPIFSHLFQCKLTLWVVASLKHMQLMGVVGEGEDFNHRVQHHYNPTRRFRLRFQQNEENSSHIWVKMSSDKFEVTQVTNSGFG